MVIDLELPAAAPRRLSAEAGEAGGYEGQSSADQQAAETEGEDGESEEQLILTLTVEFFDVIRSTICRFSQPVSRCRGVTDPVLPARQLFANSSAGLHTPLVLENSEGNRSKIPILFFARICMK